MIVLSDAEISPSEVSLIFPELELDTSVNVIFGEIGTVTVSPALLRVPSNL